MKKLLKPGRYTLQKRAPEGGILAKRISENVGNSGLQMQAGIQWKKLDECKVHSKSVTRTTSFAYLTNTLTRKSNDTFNR